MYRRAKIGRGEAAMTIDKDTFDLIVETAAHKTDQKVQARERRWRALFSVLVAGLALLGYTNIANLFENNRNALAQQTERLVEERVRAEVGPVVDAAVSDSFEQAKGDIDNQIKILRFNILSRKLDQEESFSNIERDAFISFMDELVGIDGIETNPDFLASAEMGIDALFQANLADSLNRLSARHGDKLVNSTGIAITFRSHFRNRILGDAVISPEIDEGYALWFGRAAMDDREVIMNRFTELAYIYRTEGFGAQTDGIYQDLINSHEAEKDLLEAQIDFLAEMDGFAGPEMKRISETVRNIVAHYDFSVAFPDCEVCASL